LNNVSIVVLSHDVNIDPSLFSRIFLLKFVELRLDEFLKVFFFESFLAKSSARSRLFSISTQEENHIWLDQPTINILAPVEVQPLCCRVSYTRVSIPVTHYMLALFHVTNDFGLGLPSIHREEDVHCLVTHGMSTFVLQVSVK
jgi:hypothetical protein